MPSAKWRAFTSVSIFYDAMDTEVVITAGPAYGRPYVMVKNSGYFQGSSDAITHPLANFNGTSVVVREWVSNFIPHFVMYEISISMLGFKLNYVSKKPLERTSLLCDARVMNGSRYVTIKISKSSLHWKYYKDINVSLRNGLIHEFTERAWK